MRIINHVHPTIVTTHDRITDDVRCERVISLDKLDKWKDRVPVEETLLHPSIAARKATLSISLSFLAASFKVVRAVREGSAAACAINHSRPTS